MFILKPVLNALFFASCLPRSVPLPAVTHARSIFLCYVVGYQFLRAPHKLIRLLAGFLIALYQEGAKSDRHSHNIAMVLSLTHCSISDLTRQSSDVGIISKRTACFINSMN
jgi:hypothetical protein